MKNRRFIFHDMLSSGMSRFIFLVALGISAVGGGIFWFRLDRDLRAVGIYRILLEQNNCVLGSYLLTGPYWIILIFLAGVVGGGIMASNVAGPVPRIKAWVDMWLQGKTLTELKVRKGDKFWYLTRLINEWYQKTRPSSDQS